MEYRQSNNGNLSEEAASILRAFEHIGVARSFTINKDSIRYNHDMPETYRQAVGIIRD